MGEKVRVGIVGCGGIARATHVPHYKKLAGVELVACADINPEAAKRMAEDFGIPRHYEDYNDMFEREELDAVSVCTPNTAHKDPAVAAMKAGAHVLTEKPMAGSLEDAKEMYEASRRTGKILIVGFQTRFRPDINALRDLVESGELGEVYYSRALMLRRWGIPPVKTFISKELSGGGPLLDIGCYAVDTAMYVLGFPRPRLAFGMTYDKFGKDPKLAARGCWGSSWRPEEFDVEDNYFGMVKFETGLTLLLETNWASFIPSDVFNVALLGTRGGAQLEPLELYKDLMGTRVTVRPQDPMPKVDIYEERIVKFVESVREGRPLFSPAIEGLRVQAVLDAAYRSASEGKAVPVDLDPWRE
jgi:predicted dehydrogenase